VEEPVVGRVLGERAEGTPSRGPETTVVHVVVVVGLAEKKTDNGGLGTALGISGVLEDGGFGQSILLEDVEALGVLVMEVLPPRWDYPGTSSGFDEVLHHLEGGGCV
jgi:hypothetical protein